MFMFAIAVGFADLWFCGLFCCRLLWFWCLLRLLAALRFNSGFEVGFLFVVVCLR